MVSMRCISCNINLLSEDDFTVFKCPSCLESEIVRCSGCRLHSRIYICPKCGFKGP
ncbi:RNA-binding protein [archaeon]|nr:RNA-binding protein [archaeon]